MTILRTNTQDDDTVYGIEVKAEENLKAKSLKLFSEQYPEATAVRISMSGYRKQEWMTNIPLYLVPRTTETRQQTDKTENEKQEAGL